MRKRFRIARKLFAFVSETMFRKAPWAARARGGRREGKGDMTNAPPRGSRGIFVGFYNGRFVNRPYEVATADSWESKLPSQSPAATALPWGEPFWWHLRGGLQRGVEDAAPYGVANASSWGFTTGDTTNAPLRGRRGILIKVKQQQPPL